MYSSEDASDRETVRRFRAALAAGEEELVPADVANRILDGENPIRVWREYRGMTVRALAEKSGIVAAYLSQVKTGQCEGTVATLRKIAAALNVALDDIVSHDS
jgi:DNA-binding Xre family transcriptional regulator